MLVSSTTAALLGAVDNNAAAWREFADAAKDVAGKRDEITTLVKSGIDAVPGGRDRAFSLDIAVTRLQATYDALQGANEAVTAARGAFTAGSDDAVESASQLLANRLEPIADELVPALGTVSRRPSALDHVRSFYPSMMRDTETYGSVGAGVSGVLGFAGGTAGGAVEHSLPVALEVGGGVAAAGLAIQALGFIPAHVKWQRVTRSGGDAVAELSQAVTRALDGTPDGKRVGTLPTAKFVDRISDVAADADRIATRLERHATDMGEFTRNLVGDAQQRASHQLLRDAARSAVLEGATQRHAARVGAWNELAEEVPQPELPAAAELNVLA